MFIFTQQWTMDRRIACKVPTSVNVIDLVLPFAKYLVFQSWPFGRVIKNASDFHGECKIENNSTLVYLGQTLAEVERTMTTLKEQHMYMMLNKAF